MKKVVIFLVVIAVVSAVVYQNYFKSSEEELKTAFVVKGNVIEEVSETGQVKKADEINLNFKVSGTIDKIYVTVGELVEANDVLIKLDDIQLRIQLEEAQANLALTQAQLQKLLSGATLEEIQIIQTSVDNAHVAWQSAEQKLADIKIQGEENLKAAQQDSINTTDDAYLKISNAHNAADLIYRTYFTNVDQVGVRVKESKDKIGSLLNQVKPYLDTAKATMLDQDINSALSAIKSSLEQTASSLEIIRDACEDLNYRNVVSSTNKSLIDTHRGYINTALTNVVNDQQTIASTKTTNSININTYQASLDSAKGSLKSAQDNLAKITAAPRQEDIDLYQAQVNQAKAKVMLLNKNIEDAVLRSPVKGQIVKINKRVGEIVQAAIMDNIVTVLPDSDFRIEVDIYEEDVAKMKISDPVDIFLVAFPDQKLQGSVTFIDPAEKIIDGVVYYEVYIEFSNSPAGLKPGMTVDLLIRTDFKDNVLVVPESSIKKKDGKTIVDVLIDGNVQEKEIIIGLAGSNNLVEIVSGLNEGDKVVIK